MYSRHTMADISSIERRKLERPFRMGYTFEGESV